MVRSYGVSASRSALLPLMDRLGNRASTWVLDSRVLVTSGRVPFSVAIQGKGDLLRAMFRLFPSHPIRKP